MPSISPAWFVPAILLLTGAAPSPTGYTARRLPLPADVLPSCLATRPDGTILVGSLDGDIHAIVDINKDGLADGYKRWAGTLTHWPLGLRAEGDDVIVATKGALLRLSDRDRDGWAERWTTLADAWDVTRDHHDWTTGVVPWPGPGGGWVVCPVTDDVRAKDVLGRHHLRGKALRVGEDGKVNVLAEGLRYPTGWAARPGDGAVFFTDNQGQQKTTCEINRLVDGAWYGYPSRADSPSGHDAKYVAPSVRIPYPWARSVNGLAFVDAGGKFGPIDGQLILCEYNNRFLLRASLDEVDGTTQGACYPFVDDLLGPVALTFGRDGSLYVGSLREPAWGGEPEQGAVFRLTFDAPPVGLREVTARPDGFALSFFGPVAAVPGVLDPSSYRVRRYRHVFAGSYHTPPTDEQSLTVARVTPRPDGRSVALILAEPLLPDRIYEVRTTLAGARPAVAHYTMNVVPKPSTGR